MHIRCNMPGGFRIFRIHLKHGDNVVDDDLWNEAVKRLDPRFLAGITSKPKGSMPPWLEIEGETPEPVNTTEPPPDPEPPPELMLESPPPLNVKETVSAIQACGDLDELAKFEQGETRKTVLTAIEKRVAQLADKED